MQVWEGFGTKAGKNSLDSSIRLPKIDLRIEIFLFKLVYTENFMFGHFVFTITLACEHRIKISTRRATQRCNVSAFFYAKICSLLARRRSSQPVQRVYWPENVIDWLGKWQPTCVMRHARGQKLQSFRRKWPFWYGSLFYAARLYHYICMCVVFPLGVKNARLEIVLGGSISFK